ncbi:phage tail tape measure protein [Salmonella enterica]|nr:phage tail tape measure protein [Salmonella enterica]
MSANAGTLAVNLHVNSASFKAELLDAYQKGANAARRFATDTRQETDKAARALDDVGKNAQSTGGKLATMSNRLGISHSGFEQLRSVLSTFASGSNVAASTLSNALIPAISKTLAGSGVLGNAVDSQREAYSRMAQEAYNAARAQIAAGQAARSQAMAEIESAQGAYDEARALEEKAVAQANWLDGQRKVNEQYGLSVNYSNDYLKINNQLKESDIATAMATKRMEAASKAVTEAEVLETAGKERLVVAMQQLSAENFKVAASSRLAEAGTGLLRGAMVMLGGPVGLAVIGGVTAMTALWSAYDKTQQQAKALNKAMLDSSTGITLSLSRLHALNLSLGDTDESMKAVTAAVSGGFSGDMLEKVTAVGSRLEALGGSAEDLVRELSSISGDPVKAMEAATQKGYEFNASQIEQIATLARQGKEAEAIALLQKIIINDVSTKLYEQELQIRKNAGWWDKLGAAVKRGFAAYGQAQVDTARMQASAMGVDIDKAARDMQAARDAAKKTEEEKTKALQKQMDQQRQQIQDQVTVNTLLKAGTSKTDQYANSVRLLKEQLKSGNIDAVAYAKGLAGAQKLYGDHTRDRHPKAYHDSEGVRRLAELQQQYVVLKAQGQQTYRMTDSQKKLLAFDQEIASYRGKKLTDDQKSVLAMQGQIRAQLQVNAGVEQENVQRRIAQKLQRQLRDIHEETTRRQQEQQNAAARVTMSEAEYAQMTEIQQIRDQFAKRKEKLDNEVTDHTSALYQQQTQMLRTEMEKQIAIVQQSATDKQKAENDFGGGVSKGMKDWVNNAGSYATQVAEASKNAMDGMVNNITAALNGNKVSWRSWATSILTEIEKIMINATIVNSIKGLSGTLSGSGGWLGSVGSWLGGLVKNARGGVYASSGISAYSSAIVDRPTVFPFAKGTGLMGEAGPEGILPLTRNSKGQLSVHAVDGGGGGVVVNQQFHVVIQNDGGNGQISPQALKDLYNIAKKAAMDVFTAQGRDGGKLSGVYR